jgi:putative flippase GtrA
MSAKGVAQFLRFAMIGATGTLAQYGVLWLGVDFLDWSPVWASALGYILGSMVNYILNYHFTFSSNASHVEAASRFYVVVGIGWLINTVLMALMTGWLTWNYWLAQILTTGVGLGWNFTGCKLWAFRHRHDTKAFRPRTAKDPDVGPR